MTDSSSPKPPARRIDRASLERVLARASELQALQAGSGETPDEFTEEQLLELGKEVGLSPQHLRQALAEERTRSIVPDDETGLAATLFGPSRVRADRTVPGRAEDVLGSIDVWMQRTELLIVKRYHSDRIVWEPRRDFLVGIKRALKVGGRDYALSQAFEASATVVQVDEGRVHVGLDADFRTSRRRSAEQMAATTVVAAAGSGALMLMGVMAAVAFTPLVVIPAAGLAGARALQARVITRAQLALEQLLDRLERQEIGRRGADSLLGAIVAAANAIPPRRP
jgi:hypothetical protein